MSEVDATWTTLAKADGITTHWAYCPLASDCSPIQTWWLSRPTDDLRLIYFATTRATRKYGNILQDPQASFLVDDRNNTVQDFHQTSVVTAMGLVHEVKETGRESIFKRLSEKAPRSGVFRAFTPNCAHLKINVTKYIVVTRFQNVFEIEL